MTLTQLKHFVALAEMGSFSQTAKAVFLTQPALTRSIKALEEELGMPLFDRLGKRIHLTPFGDEALQKARQILSQANSLKTMTQTLVQGQTGELRIGLGSGPGALFAVRLMSYMAQHHPKLTVNVSRGNTDSLLRMLSAQTIDTALLDIRAMRPSGEFEVTHQFEMSAGFLVRFDHPLLKQNTVRLQDITHFPVLSTPLSDEVARMLIQLYGPSANPDTLVTLRSDETSHIVDVARQTDAVVLAIRALAIDLVRLPVMPPMTATARFGLVTLANRSQAPSLSLLRQILPQWIAELQALD